MYQAIEDTCKEMGLQYLDVFRDKIIQIYEMILVRHGLMVVGWPFSAKTSAIKVLLSAINKLNQR